MRLDRRIKIQLAIFATVALVAGSLMAFGYVKLPAMLFGLGRYQVKIELPNAAGLYETGNVTYRGTEVGRVQSVDLAGDGAQAVLSLNSDVKIPADVEAQVHSTSAVGEQYVALIPRSADGPMLKDGDVIGRDRTTVPPDINALLDATSRGLEAIPNDNLKTLIDESATAVGGLGPDIARIVKGSTTLAIGARDNLDSITNLIDNSKPLLDSQSETDDSIRAWASNLAGITRQLREQDSGLSGLLAHGGEAADQARQLIDRLKPTLPVLLSNLSSVGDVAVTYQPALEQLLVLVPAGVQYMSAGIMANGDTKQPYRGQYLDFNLNINLPPVCTTGFLPAQQTRNPVSVDAPPRAPGNLYCRIPQDSPNAVRGARNYPCQTRPGKRAATVRLCESDENYVPLNDGNNWKGDPNATLTGQSVPQLDPGESAPASPPPAAPSPQGQPLPPRDVPPPIAVAQYDPATGTYIGPDGKVYNQANLARTAPAQQDWKSLLLPAP
jgi:phospholipid/cholesterol/gamma-HCH transport system substrate-binding protein